MQTTQPHHSYRCQLIPPHLAADEVEQAADARALPELRLRAANAAAAMAAAHHLSGRPVTRTERVECDEVAA